MGMAAPPYYTADMVRALPDDGKRYELVHGELLVTPSPRGGHQLLVTRLATALTHYLDEYRVGVALVAPADISWGRSDLLVQPDVFVLPPGPIDTMEWGDARHLLLAVEVLSPSSLRADRFTKRRVYQEQGVPLYWVVDRDARQVEVWTPDAQFPAVERDHLVWHPTGAPLPFTLSLAGLFRPV
jgi:Uma2 family endonuclease